MSAIVMKETITIAVAGGWAEGQKLLDDFDGRNGLRAAEAALLFLESGVFLLNGDFWRGLGHHLRWDHRGMHAWKGEALRFFDKYLDGLPDAEVDDYLRKLIDPNNLPN